MGEAFLDRHYDDIGQRSTFDLRERCSRTVSGRAAT